MPTPAKTSASKLVEIGMALAAEGGADAVTISAVAKAAGIKGPSLYKHFADRGALLTAIEIAVLRELEAVLLQARGRTPRQRILAIAHAYRAFAGAAPWRYGIIYRRNPAGQAALTETYQRTIQPLFTAIESSGVPQDRVLSVARVLAPFLHGFVSMEIARAFRLGGSLDEAFATGLEIVLKGL